MQHHRFTDRPAGRICQIQSVPAGRRTEIQRTLRSLVARHRATIAIVVLVTFLVVTAFGLGGGPAEATGGIGSGRPGTHSADPLLSAALARSTSAFWLLGSKGNVGAFGGTFAGSLASAQHPSPIVGLAATSDGGGYWEVSSGGTVFPFGDAANFGSPAGDHLPAPIVAMAAFGGGRGYRLAASDGEVFTYGPTVTNVLSVVGRGSKSVAPVVAITSTPDGYGYWLAHSNGHVDRFGNAGPFGSPAGDHLPAPIVAMAATTDGRGYWLAGSDGSLYAFGDAHQLGAAAAQHPSAPIVGLAADSDGGGYWMAASDGSVYPFGDAPALGTAKGNLPQGVSVLSMAGGPGNLGHSANGGDFAPPPPPPPPAGPPPPIPPYPHASGGFDISWPQCGKSYPPSQTIAVVGATGGLPFTVNRCLPSEAAWAGSALSLYMNLSAPVTPADAARGAHGPAGDCSAKALLCYAYNFGYNAAAFAVSVAQSAHVGTPIWWLDVETGNYWSPSKAVNDQVLAGAIDAVHHAGAQPGVYGTAHQWNKIAGGFNPGLPVWYATGVPTPTPQAWCTATSFAGGPVYMVQHKFGPFDGNYSC